MRWNTLPTKLKASIPTKLASKTMVHSLLSGILCWTNFFLDIKTNNEKDEDEEEKGTHKNE